MNKLAFNSVPKNLSYIFLLRDKVHVTGMSPPTKITALRPSNVVITSDKVQGLAISLLLKNIS